MHSFTKSAVVAVFLLACSFLGVSRAADIFIATMRAPAGSPEAGGQLYVVDSQDGSSRLVGRILLDGTQPVGLTAMSFHPRTNLLYGITWGINDASRAALLTIDPETAEARVVGRLSMPLTDISFDPEGRLFGWTANTGQLAFVDIDNARVTLVGEPASRAEGGAFAIDSRGKAYVASWSEHRRLDAVDLRTGRITPGPELSSLPDAAELRSMAFSRDELLAAHGVRTGRGAFALLRIDAATGAAMPIGEIPEDSEAIAVAATHSAARSDRMRWIAYGALAAILLALSWMYFRGRRGGPALQR